MIKHIKQVNGEYIKSKLNETYIKHKQESNDDKMAG